MGVLGLLKQVTIDFKDSYSNNLMNGPTIVDTLFVDGNQLYYEAEKYCKGNNIRNIFNVFLNKIEELFRNIFKPTKWVFFSMDGSCPAAKYPNLRKRKFRFRPKYNPTNNFTADFNKNLISRIVETDTLRCLFKKLISENIILAENFYFSPCSEPGESEHKYLEFFREMISKDSNTKKQKHMVYTSDNDLIILLLQFYNYNFVFTNVERYTVDIKILQNLILDKIFGINQRKEQQKVLNDVVALSFIMGNDFVPCFSDLLGTMNLFKLLIEAYSSFFQTENLHIINEDSFIFSNLRIFVENYFFSGSINENEFKGEKINDENIIKGEEIKKLLTFTWRYYSKKCPSWTFYSKLRKIPPLSLAIKYLNDNNDVVFDDEPELSNIVQELLFKDLITHPITNINIPETIYNKKRENSENHWKKFYSFDLGAIIEIYKEAKMEAKEKDKIAIKELSRKDQTFVISRNQIKNCSF